MKEITLEELLEAGCHFGHQVTRSNPKARDFVFESRDNIQIIDLAKTKQGLDEAAQFVKELGQNGKTLLVVATKKQAKQLVEEEALRIRETLKPQTAKNGQKLFYITQRWIGGILTNFTEVSRNFKKLADLKAKLESPEEKAKYTKKEIGLWDKERQRLELFYQGISEMSQKPDALFIVDSHLENLAVRESLATNVTTVAIVDTNADPFVIDYPIPANDDAVGSIKLIVSHILDAFALGVKSQKASKEEKQETQGVQKPKEAKKTEIKAQKPSQKKEKPKTKTKTKKSAKNK
ncbi:MAG: 30S ribosomal protein S2 [Candidatus Levybacteria bacterium]|nr:30S ribosomal protein S2 [Candidatus Levybacteria bacterium]